MNIQPLLTDFPSTTLATSKRVHQAAIRRKRHELLARTPSGYGVILEDVLPPRLLGAISFKGVLDLLATMHDSFRVEAGRPRRHTARLAGLIDLMSRRRTDPRPGRTEPRAVKRRPKPFALLTKSRREFIEILHRSTYRKTS